MMTASSPLTSPGALFPQGAGNFHQPDDGPAPSTSGDRPLLLRFAQPRLSPRDAEALLPPSRYCHDRQISIDSATGEPWSAAEEEDPGNGTMKTTGPSTDGGPSTGGEEWTPDFMGDMS